MNNNRGNNNNNRRRGRGTNNNNNRQQGGGGQQLNRIDSRARGNAPQMLEKYRKLAHDAHLNGDRVQEEFFLQYADHYFRVIADQRQRQDEQRAPRPSGERWQEGAEGEREENDDSGEYGSSESEYQPYERQSYNRSEREERPREERPREERPREDRPRGNRQRDNRPAEQQAESTADADESVASADETVTAFEPPENPFVREARPPRGLRPRREDRTPRAPQPAQDNSDGFESGNGPRFDPSILPPPISVTRDESPSDDADTGREAAAGAEQADVAAPRRRVRRPRPPVDDSGEVVDVAS
ncbi:MAG: DUF4167 domain-containing protein [Novosphingobium sp.]